MFISSHSNEVFLLLWFAGWFIIALNYSLDAFLPDFLRKPAGLLPEPLSTSMQISLFHGALPVPENRDQKLYFWGIGAVWPVVFAVLSIQNLPAVHVIRYTYLSVFTLYILVGIIMIRLARLYGKHVLVLGLLNLAWVCNNLISSFILELPHMAPYVVSQLLLIINAVGLLQFYFKQQKDAIREGLENVTYLTLHDGLTGLYNKAYFDEKLREMENDRDRLPISLIVGDMNGLKFVNDVFGHHEGDQKLKKVAFVIRQCCA